MVFLSEPQPKTGRHRHRNREATRSGRRGIPGVFGRAAGRSGGGAACSRAPGTVRYVIASPRRGPGGVGALAANPCGSGGNAALGLVGKNSRPPAVARASRDSAGLRRRRPALPGLAGPQPGRTPSWLAPGCAAGATPGRRSWPSRGPDFWPWRPARPFSPGSRPTGSWR